MRLSIVALLTVLCAACQTMSGTPSLTAPVTEIVVANQQSASATVLSSDGEARHVQVGVGPHEAAVSPDGRTAVVTIYGNQQSVGQQLAVIDLTGDLAVRTIDLGTYTRPHGVVFMGGRSDRVAVTSEATNNVVLVDLGPGTIQAVPTNARASHMAALDAAGGRAWTANVIDNSVSELDLVNRRFVRSFAVPPRPEGIAVTPDGSEVWVGSNETGAVTIISTRTGEVVHTLTGARFPYRLGVSPDGTRMAIVDGMANELVIADVATHQRVGAIPLASPRGVVIGPDNRTAYVTLAAGELAVVDIRDMRTLRTFAVQSSPDGVGVGVRR